MRKYFLSLTLILCILAGSSQQGPDAIAGTDFIGTWEGTIKVGKGIRVVFNIQQGDNSSFVSTTDSPDQGMYGFKCDTTIVYGDSIRIEIKGLRAVFAGRMTEHSKISGILTQGLPIILELAKKEGPGKEKFPQTPKPPFPYRSEDVEYDNADQSIHYGATITIPEGKGPFPAAVLITGSGQSDRDETVMGHKVFAVLADALTRNGIVVLRVDDRGIGKSTGPVMTATSADFAKDVNVSLNYLLTRPEVNKKKVGMIGHSEGGMIAPMVANQRSDIDFIVMMAGPGVKITQVMTEQHEAVYKSMGLSKKASKQYVDYYNSIMEIAIAGKDSSSIAQALKAATDRWSDTTSAQVKKEFYDSEKEMQENTDMLITMVTSNWFRYFIKYDPKSNLEKLRCKVLAINGSKDVQVVSTSNLAGIKAALEKSKSPAFIVKELPGLNHLFQTCVDCTFMEYGQLEETFSPVALKEINDWLNKYVK